MTLIPTHLFLHVNLVILPGGSFLLPHLVITVLSLTVVPEYTLILSGMRIRFGQKPDPGLSTSN